MKTSEDFIGRTIRKDICRNCGARISSVNWTSWDTDYWVHEHTSERMYPSPACMSYPGFATPCRGTVSIWDEEQI